MTDKIQPPVLWKDEKTGKLIRKAKNRKLVLCWMCPCCKPKVLASAITDRSTGRDSWDLRPYQKEKMGLPGHRWRIRETGETHHNNQEAPCTGTIYNSGTIDENGRLTGLPNTFVTTYSYTGYMELQMGCIQADGTIKWPCSNG